MVPLQAGDKSCSLPVASQTAPSLPQQSAKPAAWNKPWENYVATSFLTETGSTKFSWERPGDYYQWKRYFYQLEQNVSQWQSSQRYNTGFRWYRRNRPWFRRSRVRDRMSKKPNPGDGILDRIMKRQNDQGIQGVSQKALPAAERSQCSTLSQTNQGATALSESALSLSLVPVTLLAVASTASSCTPLPVSSSAPTGLASYSASRCSRPSSLVPSATISNSVPSSLSVPALTINPHLVAMLESIIFRTAVPLPTTAPGQSLSPAQPPMEGLTPRLIAALQSIAASGSPSPLSDPSMVLAARAALNTAELPQILSRMLLSILSPTSSPQAQAAPVPAPRSASSDMSGAIRELSALFQSLPPPSAHLSYRRPDRNQIFDETRAEIESYSPRRPHFAAAQTANSPVSSSGRRASDPSYLHSYHSSETHEYSSPRPRASSSTYAGTAHRQPHHEIPYSTEPYSPHSRFYAEREYSHSYYGSHSASQSRQDEYLYPHRPPSDLASSSYYVPGTPAINSYFDRRDAWYEWTAYYYDSDRRRHCPLVLLAVKLARRIDGVDQLLVE
ncbi:hypothetical protein CPC08DRAFT_752248 [Agrocybe pediades]|nr:hypothetical protein CPC08DRAFT_752248 [Agrocybe pediades]